MGIEESLFLISPFFLSAIRQSVLLCVCDVISCREFRGRGSDVAVLRIFQEPLGILLGQTVDYGSFIVHGRIDFVTRMVRNKFSSILPINEIFAYHPLLFLSSRVGIRGRKGRIG